MMMRISLALLVLALVGRPLAAQTGVEMKAPDDAPSASAAGTVPAPALNSRLIVEMEVDDAARPGETGAWQDVTRPRWRDPAIGAAVGVGAGLIHANAVTQGDYVGFP
ncbi:MAG TPA: hypothetical protein VHG93_04710, partial [Longimicrobium sp.]|nr:hypothetical protein [Longimicrobium sp.]